MMSPLPFQLLELNVISAQDITPVYKSMRTYAVAWVNPDRKLRTRMDQHGQVNPTWNDKFVFRVDEKFLDSETTSLMIEIYASGWVRDTLVGSVRVLINNLLPLNVRKQKIASRRRFVALQVRRPSGRPQGILNMGVTLLDNNMKSMPMYAESALGFHGQDLMDKKLDKQHGQEKDNKFDAAKGDEKHKIKKHLRRTKSDCTEVKGKKEEEEEENLLRRYKASDAPEGYGSVVLNGSSMIGSVVYDSEIGVGKNGSLCNSDVGPSASVVAFAVARGLYPTPLAKPHNPGSSILGDWTMFDDSNTEELKSKIERWRMEIPGNYDNNSMLSYPKHTPKRSKDRKRLSPDAGNPSLDERSSVFSCFGYGCEFTIVCGGDNGSGNRSKARGRRHGKNFGDSELDAQLVP